MPRLNTEARGQTTPLGAVRGKPCKTHDKLLVILGDFRDTSRLRVHDILRRWRGNPHLQAVLRTVVPAAITKLRPCHTSTVRYVS